MTLQPIYLYPKLILPACLLLMVLVGCGPSEEHPDELVLRSPDQKVRMDFQLNEEGKPYYEISYDGEEILQPSILGLSMASGGKLGRSLAVTNVQREEVSQTYTLPVGKTREARNHYHQLKIHLEEQEAPSRTLHLTFRAFNEGVAFRYTIPAQDNLANYNLNAENTGFHIPENSEIWPLFLDGFTTNYEDSYTQGKPTLIKPDSLVGLPLTFKTPENAVAAITEADLTDYAGMYLSGQEEETSLIAKLSPHPQEAPLKVKAQEGLQTPWRVVMIGANAVELTSSNIITHLNDPNQIDDPSWIKPGKVAWDWWSDRTIPDNADFEGGMNNATMEYYIDFAAEFGLEYMLVDASWYGDNDDPSVDITTSIPEIDIPHLVEYGQERNVDIQLWVNWENLDRQLEEALDTYEQWGVKGIKIDYMDRDDQEMVNYYHKVTRAAAEHQLLVNFHGAYKPTGIRRTYPNLMTREGVMGLEHAKWSKNVTPKHNVTIPFTRMLAGPMDYTPGGFDHVKQENFEPRYSNPVTMGTRCHQLAKYVIYESPLQMLADHPGAYRNAAGSEFLKAVPATWNATHPVAGTIGEYIVMARKKGKNWFLGAMSNEKAREISVPLSFLDNNTSYQVEIYADGPNASENPKEVAISTQSVTSNDNLEIRMASGGGFVATFKP